MRSPSSRRDPAYGGVAIDYSGGDQTLAQWGRGIYVSGTGDLRIQMLDDSIVTFPGLVAGVIYQLTAKKIIQAGSTAAGVVLL